MRRIASLFPALLFAACGAAGVEGGGAEQGEGGGAAAAVKAGTPELLEALPTLVVTADGPVRRANWGGRSHEGEAELAVVVAPETPWRLVEAELDRALPGHVRALLWIQVGGETTGVRTSGVPPEMGQDGLLLRLRLEPDGRGDLLLRAEVEGAPWFRRNGCDARWKNEWAWARGVAARELDALLAGVLDAVDGDLGRVAVSFGAAESSPGPLMVDLHVLLRVLERRGIVALDFGWGCPGCRAAGRRTLVSVERGLRWLAAHQAPGGGWSGAGWRQTWHGQALDLPPASAGGPGHDVATSALVLSAFLGASYTNRGGHPFAPVVSRGLRFLKSRQDEAGHFGDLESVGGARGHALATLALLQAFALTSSPLFRELARDGLAILAEAVDREKHDALTFWAAALALDVAREVEGEALAEGRPLAWEAVAALEEVVLSRLDRHRARGGLSAATAAASRHVLWSARGTSARAWPLPGAAGAASHPAYAHLGAVFHRRIGGRAWEPWNEALGVGLAGHQRDGPACCFGGSWDPPPDSPLLGGRVAATAWSLLALEIRYGYTAVAGLR